MELDEESYELDLLVRKIRSMEEDVQRERSALDRTKKRLDRLVTDLERARQNLAYIEPPLDSTIEWRVISGQDPNNTWGYTAHRGHNGIWEIYTHWRSNTPERMNWKQLQHRIDEYRKDNIVEGPYLLSSGFGGGPRLGQRIADKGDR